MHHVSIIEGIQTLISSTCMRKLFFTYVGITNPFPEGLVNLVENKIMLISDNTRMKS